MVLFYKNLVYLATLDAHVVALDNQTGVVWIQSVIMAETTIMPLAVNGKIHLVQQVLNMVFVDGSLT